MRPPLLLALLRVLLPLSAVAACDGSRSTRPEPQEIPEPPAGFLHFVDVAAGRYSACGRTADSRVYCWGRGHLLGEGEPTRPVLQAVQPLATIAVGIHHADLVRDMLCGTTASAEVVCRGVYAEGEALVPGSSGYSGVTVGGAVCALALDGAGRCWNYTPLAGVLGTTNTAEERWGVPLEVDGGRSYGSVSAASRSACALATNGETWCWGYNHSLQIGDAAMDAIVLAPVRQAAAPPFASISVGDFHSCALTPAGRAWCWGMNLYSTLGRADVETVDCPAVGGGEAGEPAPCVSTPVEVDGGLTFGAIAAGGSHTCALDLAGVAYCWGLGTWGQTGTGSSGTGNRSITPRRIVGELRFRRIVTGFHFTCAIATNDATYCWGSNQQGQLGIGADYPYVARVPHPIATP